MYQDRDLLDILCDLNHRFSHHGGTVEGNILTRYAWFRDHSEHGKDCGYALRCRDLFLRHDFSEVVKLICEAAKLLPSVLTEEEAAELLDTTCIPGTLDSSSDPQSEVIPTPTAHPSSIGDEGEETTHE